MRAFVGSIEAEYRRYKALAEAAMAQLQEQQLGEAGPGGGSSIAIIVRHMSGNLASRFTDFLVADGEKPWRRRDEEFVPRSPTRQELLDDWESAWAILFDTLSKLTDDHLQQTVRIRGEAMAVHDALHRSLAHAGYHVGQIVYLAKAMRGAQWKYLSVPPGESDTYSPLRSSAQRGDRD
jgi:hypothetical protein